MGTQFDNGGQAPWDMNVVSDFDAADADDKHMTIVPMYLPWDDCSTHPCTPYGFPSGAVTNARSYGSIPMISWGSESLQDGSNDVAADPAYSLASIASGADDSYITDFAESAKAWGHPFFLRFDWEMNGDWFTWGNGANNNTASQFVAAWRHVHDIFTSVGATNATWVWCPNNGNAQGSIANLASFYPGDAYVDWTCLDAYDQGTANGGSWQSWDQAAGPTYDAITSIAPSKPVMIGETGAPTSGGSRSAWLTQMLAEIPTAYPQVHALLYFDDWQYAIEGDGSSQSAFASGIASAAYSSDNLSTLSTPGNGPVIAP